MEKLQSHQHLHRFGSKICKLLAVQEHTILISMLIFLERKRRLLTWISGVPRKSRSCREAFLSLRRPRSPSISPSETMEKTGESSGNINPTDILGRSDVNRLRIVR
jgi:hypothetical protein